MNMNLLSRIWKSPFLDFFQHQQFLLSTQKKLVAIIVINLLVLIAVAIERQWQIIFCQFSSLVKFRLLHSIACLVTIGILAWNICVNFAQYVQCWLQLQRKFVVSTEEEKLRLSYMCHGSNLSVRKRSPQHSHQHEQRTTKAASLLSSMYLPSLSGSPDHSHNAEQLCSNESAYSPSNFVPLSPVSPASAERNGDLSASYLSFLEPYSPGRPGPPLSQPVSPANDLSSFFPSWRLGADSSAAGLSTSGLSTSSLGGTLPSSTPDYSLLGKSRYQLAAESPLLPKQAQPDQLPDDSTAQRPGGQRLTPEQTLRLLGAGCEFYNLEDGLTSWVQRMRVWLHGTVVLRLHKHVQAVNSRLRESGLHDLLIGHATLAHLQQRQVPGAAALLPFLSVTEDQPYLVRRLEELARCPSLSAFNWEGGSPDRWHNRLPNDANLLMHLLATYLDQRLPPLPGSSSESKPFTALYLLRQCWQPESTELSRPDLRILQASVQPPHYQLVHGADLWDLPHGSRNFFYCALFFFYYYVTKRGGLLRQVQLGKSGLNLAWIYSGRSLQFDGMLYG